MGCGCGRSKRTSSSTLKNKRALPFLSVDKTLIRQSICKKCPYSTKVKMTNKKAILLKCTKTNKFIVHIAANRLFKCPKGKF